MPATDSKILDAPMPTWEEIASATNAAIERANARIAAGLATEPATFDSLFGALDAAAREVSRAYGQTAFFAQVAEDDAVRDGAGAAAEAIEKWRNSLVLRPEIADAVTRFAALADLASLDPESQAYVRQWQTDVRLAGSELPEAERAEVARLTERLAELSTAFLQALTPADHIELTEAELEGLPDALIASFKPGTTPGTFDVPVDDPTVNAVLDRSPRRDVRERIYRLYLNKGGATTRALLDETLQVRRRLAGLLGYPSWQALRIEHLAAPSVEWITTFLEDMNARLGPFVDAEIAAMRQTLIDDGAPADLVFEDWDWRYADAKQRVAIGADPSAIDPYLDFKDAWAGLEGLSRDVFGVAIVAHPERTAWHPDVRAYDMVDATSGVVLSHLFVDPFVRHGKAGGAFADILDPGDRHGRSGPPRPPTMALVLNSPRPVDGVSLLSLFQASIMFHEYGHVLDFGLTTASFSLHRGDWIPFDWIEGPSGFLERWGTQPDVIARYARHHRTGEPIPVALLQSIADVEAKNTGLRTARHLSMGWLDALLHGPEPLSIDEADRRSWAARRTPYVEGASFPSSFVHLLGGYDAAVYGWVWVQAVRDDLLSRFQAEGMTSPEVGAAYRRTMLERSWLMDPLDGYRAFMGREWSTDALMARVARGSASD